MIDGSATLARRLERYRSASRPATPPSATTLSRDDLALRLAGAVDGEVIRSRDGVIVRCETPARLLPVDRTRLATMPGQPPRDTPLVCLDTETTGLATAAGTVAFLIGLGWWESDHFRQVQFLLPDHSEERALLRALEATIPPDAWLVTYNGRSFDWPLLVARYRLAGQPPPTHAGHLDLLPIVRRLFRHRMPDARLRTAEAELLGLRRIGDVEGWEIPSRYLGFLRGDSAAGLVEVVRHNDQDVRSLARLLVHLEVQLGDPARRAEAPPGDLAGLARSFARENRLRDALDCLDAATDRPVEIATSRHSPATTNARSRSVETAWWSSRQTPDFGGRPIWTASHARSMLERGGSIDAPWTTERIAIDRARLLRRIGRHTDAADAWSALAAGHGRTAIVAAIELAKLQEHRLHHRPAALATALRGLGMIDRRRRLGWPEPALEADLTRRVTRLRRSCAGAERRRQTTVAMPAVNRAGE